MVRTFIAIRDVPPGFQNPEAVLTLRLTIPSALVTDRDQVARLHEQIAHRIESVGGVEKVAVTSSITMDGNSNNDPIWVEDFPEADASIPALRRMKYLGPRYFETMGNPLIAGRDFTWAEVHNAAPVAILSENLAREYWGEPAKAIGKRVRRTSKTAWIEIIGVAGNERQDGATKPAPPTIYWPMKTSAADAGVAFVQRSLGYAIRSSRLQSPGFMAEVQQAVWSVNPNLPLARVRTLQQIYNRVDGANAVRAGDPRHRRVGDAAAGTGRYLRRDRLHRLAAPPRGRHPHGARRARATRCSASS